MEDKTPRLKRLKLTCVIALMLSIVFCLHPSFPSEIDKHKYPIEELQKRAIERSPEIQVIDQAIRLMNSKKWTALAPSVGVGNNFVGDGDIRFNVNLDLVEMLGGGKIREMNLDVAQLQLKKWELTNKIKIEVLEGVLFLESAEREETKYNKRLQLVKKKGRLFEELYKEGDKSFEALLSYWNAIDELDFKIQKAGDKVLLERAKLEQLVGVI